MDLAKVHFLISFALVLLDGTALRNALMQGVPPTSRGSTILMQKVVPPNYFKTAIRAPNG